MTRGQVFKPKFKMALLPIILFFISFKDIFSLSIPECPKPKVDQGGSLLNKVKETLESKGFVLISGKDMKKLLVQQGATEEDMTVLESGNIHKHLPRDQQPVMYHRQVKIKCTIPEVSLTDTISQISCHRVLRNITDNTIFTADTHTIYQVRSL